MQNCRNNNPYMRRANCGYGNNNNTVRCLLVLINIMWTTHLHFGRRQPVEHRGQQLIFSPRVTQLQIYMKIWPQRVRLYKDNIEVLKESSR